MMNTCGWCLLKFYRLIWACFSFCFADNPSVCTSLNDATLAFPLNHIHLEIPHFPVRNHWQKCKGLHFSAFCPHTTQKVQPGLFTMIMEM